MKIPPEKRGLLLGIPFTLLVVGLLIYGHFFATSLNPVFFTWEYRPSLYVCDSAPSWAKPGSESFDRAISFWEERGWSFSDIEVGPCAKTCKATDERGRPVEKTCMRGKVVLDLMDSWLDPEHAGSCTYPETMVMRDNDWATITVPSVILGSFNNGPADTTLPPDAEALVLAHEIGHCLVGLGHNQGPPIGCGHLNSKTGHVMNPSIYKSGWDDEALPEPPKEWGP